MKKFFTVLCLVLLMLCIAAVASAADKFAFESNNITIFEGDEVILPLIEEGIFAEGGTYTWKSANQRVAVVAADGTITALQKGESTLTCKIETASGQKRTATTTLKVARRVTSVVLNTKKLNVFEPTDGTVAEVMQESTDYPVIVIPVGRAIELTATAEPSDATNRKVLFETSDPSIVVVQNGTSIKGTKAGECDLTVYSKQNPEVTDMYHLLVVQPVSKITIVSDSKTVNVGSSLQLSVDYQPANATFQAVKWSSDQPAIATVDEYGTVTPIKKGSVVIKATAGDGSGKTATFTISVQQGPESITVKNPSLVIDVGTAKNQVATVNPANANNKNVTWTSSDTSVATVTKGGQVKGIAVGQCELYCTSDADPSVYAVVNVEVQQPVTKVVFNEKDVNVYVNDTAYVSWNVQPATATNPGVILKSSNEKIATVDQYGTVTGVKRGTCKITATSTDGSNKVGSVNIKVVQPVEGVYFRQDIYHVPYRGSLSLHSWTTPKDADIQSMNWSTDDEYVATVSSAHTKSNSVSLYGQHLGTTTLTCTTDDGGYSATAIAVVDHYHDPVMVRDLSLKGNNIQLDFMNLTGMNLTRINFAISVYDQNGLPIACTADGSCGFTGYYMDTLEPGECTQHGRFHFNNFIQPAQQIGGLILQVTSYRTDHEYINDGQTTTYSLNLPEDKWIEVHYPANFEPVDLSATPQ